MQLANHDSNDTVIEIYSIAIAIIMTQHDKIGLMCTKYTPSHYSTYLTFSITYTSYVVL